MVYLIIFVFAFPFSWMSIYWNNKLSVIYMAIKKKMHYSLKIWITQSKYWFTINQSINSTKNKYIKKKIILKGKINIFFFSVLFPHTLFFLYSRYLAFFSWFSLEIAFFFFLVSVSTFLDFATFQPDDIFQWDDD